jgi:hypothetical protein
MQWGAMGCNNCNKCNKALDPPTQLYILLGKGFTTFALVLEPR